MEFFAGPAAALAFLGRQGTRAVAISVFAGLALPPLATLMRPLFVPALVLLLVLAFLRVEPDKLRGHVTRPALVIAATALMMIAIPLAAGAALYACAGLIPAGIMVALILQASAPPIVSSPALAALMGLDAALSLAVLIACTALTPLIAPLFAGFFLGESIDLSPLTLAARLAAMLIGAALLAALVRRVAGAHWIARQRERIDGLNVIVLFIFAVALMDGAAAQIWARPLFALGLTALTFAVFIVLASVTALILMRAGRPAALAIAIASGSRNMGLMMAAAGSAASDVTWLYFALAQFPIYLLPHFLKPLAGKRTGQP